MILTFEKDSYHTIREFYRRSHRCCRPPAPALAGGVRFVQATAVPMRYRRQRKPLKVVCSADKQQKCTKKQNAPAPCMHGRDIAEGWWSKIESRPATFKLKNFVSCDDNTTQISVHCCLHWGFEYYQSTRKNRVGPGTQPLSDPSQRMTCCHYTCVYVCVGGNETRSVSPAVRIPMPPPKVLHNK